MDEETAHYVDITEPVTEQSPSGSPNLIQPVRTNVETRLVHLAVLKGDWEEAKWLFTSFPEDVSYGSIITGRNETALHIAVTVPTDNLKFVEEVVANMSDEALETRDDAGNTAFFVATIAGKIEFVKVMMNRKPDLAMIRGGEGELPLYMAASRAYAEIADWLYNATNRELEYQDKIKIFVALISSNIYDVALEMLKDDRQLAIGRVGPHRRESGLFALAQKMSLTSDLSNPDFPPPDMTTDEKITWTNFICKYPLVLYDRAYRQKISNIEVFELLSDILRVVFDESKISDLIDWDTISIAARNGNVEFLSVLIDFYPDLLSQSDNEQHYTIFHLAVLHRQEEIFRLIHEFYSIKEKITSYRDDEGNNMLHLAAKLPRTSNGLLAVSGPALQMQLELLWYKEVEKVVPFTFRSEMNKQRKTPLGLFMESHEDLLKAAEKWMRGTADKCMLVATLVATVVFSAAFQLPGGDQDNGNPAFLHNTAFKFFFMADAVSLVSSVASVMIFLGLMTSKYQMLDFHLSLPRKLIIGLALLFISLASMLMAFVATTFLVFNHDNNKHHKNNLHKQHHGIGLIWFAIPIAVVGAGPIILLIWMHLRLFMDAWNQTINPESIFKQNEVPVSVKVSRLPSMLEMKKNMILHYIGRKIILCLCRLCQLLALVAVVVVPITLWKTHKL